MVMVLFIRTAVPIAGIKSWPFIVSSHASICPRERVIDSCSWCHESNRTQTWNEYYKNVWGWIHKNLYSLDMIKTDRNNFSVIISTASNPVHGKKSCSFVRLDAPGCLAKLIISANRCIFKFLAEYYGLNKQKRLNFKHHCTNVCIIP